MVDTMDAYEEDVLATYAKELQEDNPTLQFGRSKDGGILVNGIKYRGEEYW